MQDLEKALQQIGDIRSQIASSTEFHGFGPAAVATTGVIALATGAWQYLQSPGSTTHYLLQWIVVAAVCSVIVCTEMYSRSRHEHGQLAAALLVRALEQFLPAFACGFMLTAFCFLVAPDTLWMLPGLWQECVALGLFSAARNLTPAIKLVAAFYFVCGFTVLILSHQVAGLSPWLMALPFFAGQLMMAFALYRQRRNGVTFND